MEEDINNKFIVFLDIDGVMHPVRKLPSDPYFVEECTAPLFEIFRNHPLEVVISSTWKDAFSLRELRDRFPDDLRPRIIGVTPSFTVGDRYTRHKECLLYLKKKGGAQQPWIAIDDSPDHFPPLENVLITDPETGFTRSDAEKLAAILKLERVINGVAVNTSLEKLRLSFMVPGKLAGMSWPDYKDANSGTVDILKHNRIHTLINLTTRTYGDGRFSRNFEVLNIPVANMTAPTPEQVDEILAHYRNMPDDGAMSVHCMHGLGRTGTVIACLIGREYKLKPNIAILAIRRKRPGSIESEEQEQFVYDYLSSAKRR